MGVEEATEVASEKEAPRNFYYVQQSPSLKALEIDILAGPIREVRNASMMTNLKRK